MFSTSENEPKTPIEVLLHKKKKIIITTGIFVKITFLVSNL